MTALICAQCGQSVRELDGELFHVASDDSHFAAVDWRHAVEMEREACAQVALGSYPIAIDVWMTGTKKELTALMGEAVAAAIRARGAK